MGVERDEWGVMLHYIIMSKIDNDSRKEYELKYPGTSLQTVDELVQFLKERAAALENYSTNTAKGQQQKDTTPKKDATSTRAHAAQGE